MSALSAGPLRPARFLVAAILAGAASIAMPAQASAAASAPKSLQSIIASEIGQFYQARANRPLWLDRTARSSGAADMLLYMLSTADSDGLDPARYRTATLKRLVRMAKGGNPAAVARADRALSAAFVAYVRDTREAPNLPIIWVDPELRPTPPSASQLLNRAAAARSLREHVADMRWMNPIYVGLRTAIERNVARNAEQVALLKLNLERARTLPEAQGKYIVVNATGARLTMYEGGRIVDSMRVVVGQPKYPTPMMAAYIRYTSLNPYWNVPPDLAAERIAPNVLKQGPTYLRAKGYQVLSDWSDNARPVNPRSIDWKAVVEGREQVRMRQLPGPSNSMGEMKFMFPNAMGIYLHDTPRKELLSEAARMFSGGCVRLEDAPRLARWLYGRSLQPRGRRPEQRVDLPEPVPVYITYLTAMPAGGGVAYFPDVYGRDRQQMATLGLTGRRDRG